MRKKLNAGVCLSAAGLACSAATGQFAEPVGVSLAGAPTITPVSVQPILGVRTDGGLVLGERVRFGERQNADQRRGPTFAANMYDSLWIGPDTDGDGAADLVCGDLCAGLTSPASRWTFGVSPLGWVDDVEFSSASVWSFPNFNGYALPTLFPVCDPPGQEPLIVIFTVFDSPATGFDTNGDGQIDSPYSRSDADGDGLVDEFTAGFIATFANVDTDGDTSNGADILDVAGGENYFLTTVGIAADPFAPNIGGFPSGDSDGDGNPDGVIEVFFAGSEGPDTDGDGFPDSGSIYNAFEPSQLSPSPFYWGTPDTDNSGCAAANGITEGSSGGILWAQTEAQCQPGSAMVSNVWDASTDLTDLTGVVGCPDPLTPAIVLSGVGFVEPPPPCADANGDGFVTPADFNAWILAFNSQLPACDQNGDGLCTPADFNAWVINFNSGAPCP